MKPATSELTFSENWDGQMLDKASHQTIGILGLAAAMLAGIVPSCAANIDHGRRLLSTHCARCHAIDKVSASPLAIAPPFRTLHERYPVETLEEALAEGIVTGHPSMPEFRFDGDEVGDIIAFLKTLK
jgi:mono/diheme cytochrome c family protein